MADARTALGEIHEKAGAQFESYGEFQIPSQFTRPEAEFQGMKEALADALMSLDAGEIFKTIG